MTSRSTAYAELRRIEGRPIIDCRKRKGDRHKGPKKRSTSRTPSKWDRRDIVAWDGEGANLDNGIHVYNLLANSCGDCILDHKGLSTSRCFDFFLDHSKRNAINVIYGGSYDVNMMLIDVDPPALAKLWVDGNVYWRNYRIWYKPRKSLTIQRFSVNRNTGQRKAKNFTLWDVLGFFQGTFVNACRQWLGNMPILDDIEDMKYARSEFTTDKIEEIIAYNKAECDLLVAIMEALFAALDRAGIRLNRYDGAGSIAGALLRMHNVKQHMGDLPPDVKRLSQYAYSGGRIEAVKLGNLEDSPVYRYDINSAYPYAATLLPSFKDVTWEVETRPDSTFSIVHVEWDYRTEAPFYPLWYRDLWGGILYPSMGSGYYWGYEVANLAKHYKEGEDYRILQAVNPYGGTDVEPFGFLKDVYAIRKKYKDQGLMASEALKLGMNSIYGKLAQQAGYRDGRIPTYHNLSWAGLITAITRARLYAAAMQNPNSVIAFATDAVITTEPLSLPISGDLGDWTAEVLNGITIVQAGVYWLKGSEGWQGKYRGFDKGSLEREKVLSCWDQNEEYEASLTRFVTMGSALASKDFYSIWRKWITSPRKLDILPTGKRQPVVGKKPRYSQGLFPTRAASNVQGLALSAPYPLLWVEGQMAFNAYIGTEDGVSSRVLDDEVDDTYA